MSLPYNANLVVDEEPATVEVQQSRSPQLTPTQDRITAVLNMYHEHHGEQPFCVPCTFSSATSTVEQPFSRRVTVEKDPIPLDTGWIDDVGYILLENKTGESPQTIPSEEEEEELALTILKVTAGNGGIGMLVRPGRFLFVELEDASTVWLSAAHNTVSAIVHVFPR